MKIFGTIDSLQENATDGSGRHKNFVYGAWVASETFYRALLKYGTFDEYHFFVSSSIQGKSLKIKFQKLNISPDKIKIIGINSLPSYLQKTKYTVFFTADLSLWRLSYLRSAFVRKYFPICGINHSFSYTTMLKDVFFHNMVSNLESFDSIICSSRAVQRAIRNLNRQISGSFKVKAMAAIKYNGRLDQLPLGIEPADFGKLSKQEAREKLKIGEDKIVILYFGRFSLFDKADLYPVLLAFKEILQMNKRVLLLLAGADAQDKYGRRLKQVVFRMGLSDSVKFILPWVKDKACLYSASDIFISPSDNIQESFGLTILEAMSSGLPVAASDWDGYRDIIVHNETGLLIPSYWADSGTEERCLLHTILDSWQYEHLYLAQSVCLDVNKIKEYLLLLINNKELRLRLGENGKRRVFERFGWKVVISEYEKLWLKLSRLSESHKVTRKKKSLFMPEYFDCFRHYASRILGKNSRIAVDKGGLEFLKTRSFPFKIQKELLDTISVKNIFMILTFLLGKDNVSIGDIEDDASRNLKLKKSIVRYNIMWMLKKGLLRISPSLRLRGEAEAGSNLKNAIASSSLSPRNDTG